VGTVTALPELRVMLEWRAYPLWTVDDDGGVDNPSPDSIVAEPLAGDLDRWALDYDARWDPDDPGGSQLFSSAEDEAAFYARGRELAVRVAAEVGDRWAVRFQRADRSWEQLS
jgi:hypothetical protein